MIKNLYKKLPYKIKYILWKYPKHIFNNLILLNIDLLKLSKKLKKDVFALPLKNLNTQIIIKKELILETNEPEALIQYFKYYIPKSNDVIIDAGSFKGHFSILAYYLMNKKGKIICFEPDIKNYDILKKNIKKFGLKNVIIIKKGLWNKKTLLNFESNGEISSILNKGNEKIKVIDIDSELKRLKIKKINFIKMDIEGAEIEALEGMKKTLIQNKCKLAIASYHKINGEKTYKKCETFLKKLNYCVKTENKKHLTTYAYKL